jgi:GNAT superfamily N-acetyltransferase
MATTSDAPAPAHPAVTTMRAPGADAISSPVRWVPIRSLAARHRSQMLVHLLELPSGDRYLRFGYLATDEHIQRYVETLDFSRDELLGIFSRSLRLLAVAHLACVATPDHGSALAHAEFGVSVSVPARGRGYGKRLFDLAALHARNRGIKRLLIHALSENEAMLRIARLAGAQVVRHGGEAQALLELPGDTMASQIEQLVAHNAAEWDYRFKDQARRIDHLIAALTTLTPQDPAVQPPAIPHA